MDPFLLGLYLFVAFMVGLCIYTITNDDSPGTLKSKQTSEDQNLKYLAETKRYEYWRENNGSGS